MAKANALDPKFVQPYQRLAGNAGMRGENGKAADYRKKLMEAVPDDLQYVVSYARAIADKDLGKAKALALSVVLRAPQTDTGASALTFVADQATTDAERIEYYERLRRDFAAWFPPSASDLFDLYAKAAPEKAAALAWQMANDKVQSYLNWSDVATMQENIVRARTLLAGKQAGEALALLEKTAVPKYAASRQLDLLKAEAENAVGEAEKAYDRLAATATSSSR